MAPNSEKNESVYCNEDNIELKGPQAGARTYRVIYTAVFIYVYWHIAGLYGLYLVPGASWKTILFSLLTFWLSILGVTAGAHRLWSHQSYKVNRPLEIFLMLCQSMSCQNSAVHWLRDHKLHHKYTDTDADPHNSTRGLFYSHYGWLLVEKHPECIKKGKNVDMSDSSSNPVLMFQKKYIKELTALTAMVLPTFIPMLCWGETFNCAWHLSHLRLIVNLNFTFLVNSANHNHAHGHKPYDKAVSASNIPMFSIVPVGETYHNFHHVFPWDYRNSEIGNTFANVTTMFIDFCARRGWAWDLKAVSPDMVKQRMERTGDGTDLWGKRIEKRSEEPQETRDRRESYENQSRQNSTMDVAALTTALTEAINASKSKWSFTTDLPSFSGYCHEWLQFKAAFNETAPSFAPSENVARIRKGLKGVALEAVSALLISQPRPEDIMNALEQRYGRPDALLLGEMEKMKTLPRLTDGARDLCVFASRIANTVTTIELLKKPQYLYNPEVLRVIVEKLTPILRNKY